MISVQVTDENMGYPVVADLVFQQLHLGTFPAIDQKIPVAEDQILCRRMSVVNGCGGTASEDGQLKTHGLLAGDHHPA